MLSFTNGGNSSNSEFEVSKLNIFEDNSFKAWKNLRRVTSSFGKQYFNKHVANTQATFWIGILCITGSFIATYVPFGDDPLTVHETEKAQFCFLVVGTVSFLLYFLNFALVASVNSGTAKYTATMTKTVNLVKELAIQNPNISGDMVSFKEAFDRATLKSDANVDLSSPSQVKNFASKYVTMLEKEIAAVRKEAVEGGEFLTAFGTQVTWKLWMIVLLSVVVLVGVAILAFFLQQ
jgi:hypothetical protein